MCLVCFTPDVFLILLAIVFPPLPVWIKTGVCSCESLVNILLCMLGYIPGLLHSWYVVATYTELEYEEDLEAGAIRQPGRRSFPFYGRVVYQPLAQEEELIVSSPQPVPAPVAPAPEPAAEEEAGPAEPSSAPPAYSIIMGDNKVQN
ncbi:uncharacterized protein V1510DRAFT_129405 [Dipodascopsis tothii]|uniref:uncharacterized protein n=1 Tax=Dipodascopsis tothii TaxID=44089 RepID=UPI0034CFD558